MKEHNLQNSFSWISEIQLVVSAIQPIVFINNV